MINKVTQTQCSSMYFFLLTQYTALKVLFQQRRTRPSIFFFYCLDSEKRTFRARHVQPRCWCFFWIVWSSQKYLNRPLIGNGTRRHDQEFIMSRFTWLFYMFLVFRWVSPRNAWDQDHWIYRDKWCVLKVRQDLWSLSYFKIHDVILVNFRSDATSQTVPKCIRQPYGCAGNDRRTKELPSLSQVV